MTKQTCRHVGGRGFSLQKEWSVFASDVYFSRLLVFLSLGECPVIHPHPLSPIIIIMDICKHPTYQNSSTAQGVYTSKNTDNMLQHKITFNKIHTRLFHSTTPPPPHTHTHIHTLGHTHTHTHHGTHTPWFTHTHMHTSLVKVHSPGHIEMSGLVNRIADVTVN